MLPSGVFLSVALPLGPLSCTSPAPQSDTEFAAKNAPAERIPPPSAFFFDDGCRTKNSIVSSG